MTNRFTIAIGYDVLGQFIFECVAHADQDTAIAYIDSMNDGMHRVAVDHVQAKMYCENGHGKPFERTMFPSIYRQIEWLKKFQALWRDSYDYYAISETGFGGLTDLFKDFCTFHKLDDCSSIETIILDLQSQMK